MRLDGIYTGPDINMPDGIRATGTPEEFKRVGPLPMRDPNAIPPAQQRAVHQRTDGSWENDVVPPYCTQDLPAEKPLVQQIARHVEIDCTDQRLIDWMQARDA